MFQNNLSMKKRELTPTSSKMNVQHIIELDHIPTDLREFCCADSEVESYKKLTTIHQSECREVTPICDQPIDFGQIEQRQSDGSTFSNECTFEQSRILRSAESVLEIVNFDERMKNSLKTRKPRRSPVGGKWSQEEDQALLRLVGKYGPKNWKLIAQELGGIRDKVQCLHRYNKVLKPGIQKGSWTEVEDAILLDAVRTYRNAPRIKWCEVAKNLHGRIGKQCRERWNNHVNPEIKKTSWSSEEDDVLFRSQLVFGNRWSEISKLLPGRTENNVKNRFHSKARQRWLNESRNNEYRKLPKTTVVKDPDPEAICELYQLSAKLGATHDDGSSLNVLKRRSSSEYNILGPNKKAFTRNMDVSSVDCSSASHEVFSGRIPATLQPPFVDTKRSSLLQNRNTRHCCSPNSVGIASLQSSLANSRRSSFNHGSWLSANNCNTPTGLTPGGLLDWLVEGEDNFESSIEDTKQERKVGHVEEL